MFRAAFRDLAMFFIFTGSTLCSVFAPIDGTRLDFKMQVLPVVAPIEDEERVPVGLVSELLQLDPLGRLKALQERPVHVSLIMFL